jgi:hypothetical protein
MVRFAWRNVPQKHFLRNPNRTPGRCPGWVLDGRNSSRASRQLLCYVYCLRVTFSAYDMFLVVVSPYAPQKHVLRNPNRTPGRFPGWVLDGQNSSRASRHCLCYVYCLRVTFSAYGIILVVVSPYAPPGKPPGVLFALSANAFACDGGGSGLAQ